MVANKVFVKRVTKGWNGEKPNSTRQNEIFGAKWEKWGKMRFLEQSEKNGANLDFWGKVRKMRQNEIFGAKWKKINF